MHLPGASSSVPRPLVLRGAKGREREEGERKVSRVPGVQESTQSPPKPRARAEDVVWVAPASRAQKSSGPRGGAQISVSVTGRGTQHAMPLALRFARGTAPGSEQLSLPVPGHGAQLPVWAAEGAQAWTGESRQVQRPAEQRAG